MKIFGGIDVGFDRCGVATIRNGKADYYSTIQTSDTDCFAKRLSDIEESIDIFANMYPYDHDGGNYIIGIEVPVFSSRNTNAGKVHQVLGVIMYTLHRNGHRYIEHSPGHVKAAVHGGKATKTQVKRAVSAILGIPSFKGIKDDAIDALAIAITTQLDYIKELETA